MNDELSRMHRALAFFYVATFILLSIYFFAMNPAAFWTDAWAVVMLFGVIVSLHFAAAKGVETSKWWARAISVVFGVVLLVGFPIGTAIGGYLLYLSIGVWQKLPTHAA